MYLKSVVVLDLYRGFSCWFFNGLYLLFVRVGKIVFRAPWQKINYSGGTLLFIGKYITYTPYKLWGRGVVFDMGNIDKNDIKSIKTT